MRTEPELTPPATPNMPAAVAPHTLPVMPAGEALKAAVRAAGGPVKVAEALGIRPQAVSQWAQCPGRRVLALEALCGGRVSRHALRPDLYPDSR